MKNFYRSLVVLFAATLLVGLGAGHSPAADPGDTNLSMQKQTRVTHAQRQAAADRAKAKGFVVPKIETSAISDDTTPAKGGAKK